MMGSGIYSIEVDVEFVCKENSNEEGQGCEYYWTETIHTDDRGGWDAESKCPECDNEVNIQGGER